MRRTVRRSTMARWRSGAQGAAASADGRGFEMSTEPVTSRHTGSLELSVEELLRRALPVPPHEEMLIDDLSEAEGVAFLAALEA